jgi:hypothetical protein
MIYCHQFLLGGGEIGDADWTANCGGVAALMTRRGTEQNLSKVQQGRQPPRLADSNRMKTNHGLSDESATDTRRKRLAFPARDPIKKRHNETDKVG